ncbi:MAG: Peptidoglycan glycosyltransferase [Marmoricola sp.]|nr:Peptidoglycan glycosyltransferase [Marmoricola sp.]
MNRPIRNLAIACLLLFLALMANATYLQDWEADDLTSLTKHPSNVRVADSEFAQPRGAILVDGKAIARSKKVADRFKYLRTYPFGPEYAHIAGYFAKGRVGGIEASQNDVLTGEAPGLFVNRVVDLLGNESPQGGTVSLTLNGAAQKAAYDGLKALGTNVRGAVVAIEPATGRILAMVSSPTFNPNKIATHDFVKGSEEYQSLLADTKYAPLNNRAIEERLPPGSTFKLVTAAAALSSGKYQPDTKVPGGAVLDLPQTTSTIRNENLGSCGGTTITMQRALEVSCNVAFGSIGLDVGADAIQKQAEKFGFNKKSYFTDLDDSLTSQATSIFPSGINKPQTAQSAIGQYEVAATPLQMAMVGAGIANNGKVMKPYLVDEYSSADLDVVKAIDPQVLTQSAVSASVARKLTQMMVGVVDNGTGLNARIPGVEVAGKTGTAQSAAERDPYAWFVSFAPATNARVAVAVLIQNAGIARNDISGGGLAAPIAKSVMQAVLNK